MDTKTTLAYSDGYGILLLGILDGGIIPTLLILSSRISIVLKINFLCNISAMRNLKRLQHVW